MDMQNRPQRQMHDVSSLNLTCSECSAAIKELPFAPTQRQDGTYGRLFCYDCNKKRKPSFGGGGGGRGGYGGGGGGGGYGGGGRGGFGR